MVSLRPHFVIAIAISFLRKRPAFSEVVLGIADFVEQFVERLRRESLACGQRPQHVYQEQANPKNLGEGWIAGRVSAQLPEDHISHPFASCHAFCSRDLIEAVTSVEST